MTCGSFLPSLKPIRFREKSTLRGFKPKVFSTIVYGPTKVVALIQSIRAVMPGRARAFRRLNLEKRTSAAKAVKRHTIYGTAEAVPFV